MGIPFTYPQWKQDQSNNDDSGSDSIQTGLWVNAFGHVKTSHYSRLPRDKKLLDKGRKLQ